MGQILVLFGYPSSDLGAGEPAQRVQLQPRTIN